MAGVASSCRRGNSGEKQSAHGGGQSAHGGGQSARGGGQSAHGGGECARGDSIVFCRLIRVSAILFFPAHHST